MTNSNAKKNGSTNSIAAGKKSSADTLSKGSAITGMESSQLMKLFEDSLKDIYWAEKALTKAIPKMIKNATSEDLIEALENHLEEYQEYACTNDCEQPMRYGEVREHPGRSKDHGDDDQNDTAELRQRKRRLTSRGINTADEVAEADEAADCQHQAHRADAEAQGQTVAAANDRHEQH